MKLLDFRFNGIALEAITETDNSHMGFVDHIRHIKDLGEAKRIALSLDVAIHAMEEMVRNNEQNALIQLHEGIIERQITLDRDIATLNEQKQAFLVKYNRAWNLGFTAAAIS